MKNILYFKIQTCLKIGAINQQGAPTLSNKVIHHSGKVLEKQNWTNLPNKKSVQLAAESIGKTGPAVQIIDSPKTAPDEPTVEVATFHTSNSAEPENLSV